MLANLRTKTDTTSEICWEKSCNWVSMRLHSITKTKTCMINECLHTDSRWRLLQFPIPVEFYLQRHSCNFSAGFGPAVYDFLRARTTTTASTPHLQALEETVATTSQPAQATRCKGLREEQAHPRRQLVIAVTFTLHKTN